MNQPRPEPNEKGMIPCTCCRGGYRKDATTKVKYICNHCNGTQIRKAPPHYMSQKQIDKQESEYAALDESIAEAEREEKRDELIKEINNDLLEALEKLFDCCMSEIDEDGNEINEVFSDESALGVARAAIKKAKGE